MKSVSQKIRFVFPRLTDHTSKGVHDKIRNYIKDKLVEEATVEFDLASEIRQHRNRLLKEQFGFVVK